MMRYASGQGCVVGDYVSWGPRTGTVVGITPPWTPLPAGTRAKETCKFPRLVVKTPAGKLMTPFPGSVRLVKREPDLFDYEK